MSSRSRDWSAKGNTVALPNVPKMSEEKGKMKYLTDYDKYEGEFLKHHLGSADSSYTLTLKNVPASFDRQIPSATEPTLAEREYERYVQLETQRMQKRNRAKRVARATGAIIRAASPVESEDFVPPSLFLSELLSPSKVSNLDHKTHKASRTKSNTSLTHSSSTINTTNTTTLSSFCKPSSSLNAQSTTLESLNDKNTKTESTSINGNNTTTTNNVNYSNSLNSSAHFTSNKLSIVAKTPERTSLSTEVKNQSSPLLTEHEKKERNTRSTWKVKKEKENASKLHQAEQHYHEFEAQSSSTHVTGWDDFGEVLQRALQEEEEEEDKNKNIQLLSNNTEWQLEEDGKRVYSAEECAQWLRLIVDPPNEFVSSFDLTDLDECDLSWMRVNKASTLTGNNLLELKTPRVLCNLPQYCASHHLEGTNSNKSNTLFSHTIPTTRNLTNNNFSSASKVMKINSPRSVLTLVQSGISIHDVVPPPPSSSASSPKTTLLSNNTSFSEEANTINEIRKKYIALLSPSLGQANTTNNTINSNLYVNEANELIHISRIIQQHRHIRVEKHRQQLASQLMQSYLNLCNQVSLPELLKAYQSCINMSSYAQYSSSFSCSNSYNSKMNSGINKNGKGPLAEMHHEMSEIDKTITWPTSLQLQHQKQMKLLALHKERVQRQTELNAQVEERQKLNEARKVQLAQEAATRAAMKQMQERQLQEERAKRWATQQNAKLEREAAIAEQLKRKMEKVQEQNERRAAQLEQTQKLRHAQRQHAEEARQLRLAQHQALLEQRAQEVEETQRIRANELVRLQKEREARLAEEHACLLARQRKAEETRMAAKQRALWQDAQIREAAREKQEEVRRRIETFNTERQRALEWKRQQEKEKEAQRIDVKESAHMAELQWQTKLHEEQLAQERTLASIKQHKMLECIVRNERERDEAAAKAFVVARHRRRNEFNKLLVATELMKKQSAAEFVSLQRESMLAEMRKEREVLNDERDALKRQMEEENTFSRQHEISEIGISVSSHL